MNIPEPQWLTADWHIGDKRFDLMARPFISSYAQTELIVDNYCKVIEKDDVVWFLGDVIYKEADQSLLSLIGTLPGRKVLFRGNHDIYFTDKQFSKYFELVVPEGKGKYFTIDSQIDGYATHYPTQGVKDAFNVVGHVHSAWKYQLNMLNIGVDVHHFRPVSVLSLRGHIDAATKFYDEDVWVAYNEINNSFREERGAKTRYFKGV